MLIVLSRQDVSLIARYLYGYLKRFAGQAQVLLPAVPRAEAVLFLPVVYFPVAFLSTVKTLIRQDTAHPLTAGQASLLFPLTHQYYPP